MARAALRLLRVIGSTSERRGERIESRLDRRVGGEGDARELLLREAEAASPIDVALVARCPVDALDAADPVGGAHVETAQSCTRVNDVLHTARAHAIAPAHVKRSEARAAVGDGA